MPKSKAKSESKTYQAMLMEVESIVDQISGQEIDLDSLVGKVEQAHGLISSMRERLEATKEKIEELVVKDQASHE